MHTYNHVVYVYLGINDTKIKQICKFFTDSFMSIKNVLYFWKILYIQASFNADEVGHTASVLYVSVNSFNKALLYGLG